jgi:UDP-2,3-diacylglucosamine hydrolase
MARTLFVSDVHLRPDAPETSRPFLEFLREECDALYLLGDIFDYWIGPQQLRSGDYGQELAARRARAARSRVYFVPGNRDYFVDERFARATGVRLLGERARVELGGRTALLAHGDFIYNRNPRYAAYRTVMRSRPVADLWRAVPAAVGKRLARGFKRVSRKTTPVVEWTSEDLVAGARPHFERGADVLICGHIHRAQHLTCEVARRRRDIFVLGDWDGGTRDYVEHDGRGFRLLRWE